MTEAAHQMASNPLPPGARKPGSVGPGTDVRISIMDGERQRSSPPVERGEVVHQRAQRHHWLREQPGGERHRVLRRWFRTGDQGFLDDDGYLSLVGRLKELINRGGEKISPREIDEVLLTHPAVAEAVCFGVAASDLGRRSRSRGRRCAGRRRPKRSAGVLQGAPGRLQAAEADSHHRSDSAHGDRQDPAARRRASVCAAAVVRIVIAGAGAIGGYIGARLARVGADVVLFARGPHLRAMQERGLRVISPDGDFEVTAAGRPAILPPIGAADVVFLGVKAHSLTALAPPLRAALRPGHSRRQHAERHPVVVLPGHRRRARRAASRARRSGRRHRRGDRAAAGRRIARLLRDRHRRARRHPSHRGQSDQLRRARRQRVASGRARSPRR